MRYGQEYGLYLVRLIRIETQNQETVASFH
jgi:hypothetical protein